MKSEWSRLLDDAGMLGLTPEEERNLWRQWPSVLRSAALPPLTGKTAGTEFLRETGCAALRADEPSASLDRDQALANAPAAEDGLIIVPHTLA